MVPGATRPRGELVDSRVMSPDALTRKLVRLLAALVAAEDSGVPAPEQAGVPERLHRRLLLLTPHDRRLLALGLRVLDLRAFLVSARSFDRRSPAQIRHGFAGLLGRSRLAPLRRLHQVVRMLLLFVYFCDPAAFSLTGYDGPWLGRVLVPVHPGPVLVRREAAS